MKRILTALAMTTGLIAVFFLATPIDAEEVVYEAQLVCEASPGPGECTEEDACGGEVKVYYDEGQTYVAFDFVTPLPYQDYYLYIGRTEGPAGVVEFRIGDIEGFDFTEFPAPIPSDAPTVVSTDEDGECKAELLLDCVAAGLAFDYLSQVSFRVVSVAWEENADWREENCVPEEPEEGEEPVEGEEPEPPPAECGPSCGDILSTGFWIPCEGCPYCSPEP